MPGKFVDLYASADYLGPGRLRSTGIRRKSSISCRRRGVFGQRIKQVPATGIRHGSLKKRQSMRRRRRRHSLIRATLRLQSDHRREWNWQYHSRRWCRRSTTTCSTWRSANKASSPICRRRIWRIQWMACCARTMLLCGTALTRHWFPDDACSTSA